MQIKNPVSYQIWKDRYCKNNETEDGNLHRVAKFCSNNEQEEKDLFNLLDNRLFFYGGRTMSNAGIGSSLTLNNCFNLNSVPDSIDGIFDAVRIGALTQKAGGGTGYDFSVIRPNGMPTSNDAIASGTVSFMKVFDTQTNTILQGGRRGANMGVLNIYHPDIFEFLDAKSYDAGTLVHFNLSVMIDDDFMNAVENNEDIYLHYPVYDEKMHIIKDENKWTFKKKQNAKELYDLIIKKAYDTGEYGVFFYDNLNRDNNTWYCETITGSNPCGEYVSGVIFIYVIDPTQIINQKDYKGACNLGSIFLHNHVDQPFTKDVHINYRKLKDTVTKAVRFLDNIIDKNHFPHESFKNYQENMRTIGLGINGLADLFVMMNIKYGSQESVELANELMNTIAKTAYRASIELAKEKGSFPFLDSEKFVQSGFIRKHIQYDSEWKQISDDIIKYGIRNARLLSVAPVGTLSLTYGENSSSGLEPIVMVEAKRQVKIGGQDNKDIQVVDLRDYAYTKWLETKENNIVTKDMFVTIDNLGVQEHLDILKAVTFHVDMSASKTINIPTNYSFEDTKNVYKWCWENGIKGCTIFRPNELRQGIFITEEKKEENKNTLLNIPWGTTLDASDDLIGRKSKLMTGCGSLHLQAWFDPASGRLMEIFLSKGSTGGCASFMTGLSRMISLALRTGVSFDYAIDQLKSVQACPSYVSRGATKHDTSQGNCCPSAIANALVKMQKEVFNDLGIEEDEKIIIPVKTVKVTEKKNKDNDVFTKQELEFLKKNGEIAFAIHFSKCPKCSEELEHAEGCLTCTNCGFTKC